MDIESKRQMTEGSPRGQFPDCPADEVLLELGRLVWAAINLEDVVYTVCRSVRPRRGPSENTPIGTRINEAIADLADRPNDDLRKTANAWLEEVRRVLEERNSVVHSVPGTFVFIGEGIPTPDRPDDELMHFPRDKSRPVVRTSLTVESLGAIRQQLQAARVGWADLAPKLWASRSEVGDD